MHLHILVKLKMVCGYQKTLLVQHYGTTGFHLKFENASDLGNDSSGNNNDWTASNMGTDHQVLDSPTFGELINMASSGNFCTWNPLM